MKLLEFLERFLFETAPWRLVSVIAVLIFVKVGVWYMPNLGDSNVLARNPFVNPFANPDAHYLMWNWFGPFLAWATGLTGRLEFFLLHLAFSIAFFFLVLYALFKRFEPTQARTAFLLFIVLPVSATAFFWVGTDSITLFIFTVVLVFPRPAIIPLLAGLLLGMEHFEQAFLAFAALLFSLVLTRMTQRTDPGSTAFTNGRRPVPDIGTCLFVLFGDLLGKVLLSGLFHYWHVEMNSGRLQWLKEHFTAVLSGFALHFEVVIWSVLGLGWIAALRYLDLARKPLPFFASLLGLCLTLPFFADQTRVLAIVSFPLIATYWLLNEELLARVSRREVAGLFLAWVVMPWSWVWSGLPKWSAFPFDVAFLIHAVSGAIDVPRNLDAWPF